MEMDPTVEQLALYIMQELGRGIPEQTLRANLMQHGWSSPWIDAALQIIHQRYPAQQQSTNSIASPPAGSVLPGPRKRSRVLVIAAVVFIILVIAAALFVPRLMQAVREQTARDNARRDDLAGLLSDLSDYYRANSKYPTLAEINDPAFRTRQGFDNDVIKDPEWSLADKACVKNGRPVLSETIQPHCYAYETSTSEGAPCNNGEAICTRMSLTMLFEKGNQTSQVAFDRDNELE